jgi:hypothetical protein
MATFPPINPSSPTDNIFKTSYWEALANGVGAGGVLSSTFWNNYSEADEVTKWSDLIPILHSIDARLKDAPKEPELYIYKTKGAQDLRDMIDWYKGGGLASFRKFVRQEKWRTGNWTDSMISSYLNNNRLISPVGGHVGSLQAILAHQQDGPATLRFTMRQGIYAELFSGNGQLAFSTQGRSLKYVASYFRNRPNRQYSVKKLTLGGSGEAYLTGWLGVKGEDDYLSFAIGGNDKSKALFSILVNKCEWVTRPTTTTTDSYETHKWP